MAAVRSRPGRLVNAPAGYQAFTNDAVAPEMGDAFTQPDEIQDSKNRAGAGNFTIEHDD